MAVTGLYTWIMKANGDGGAASVSSSIKFDESSVNAQAVIRQLITYDSDSISQAAITGYWHKVNGVVKFVDLSDNPASCKIVDHCTGIRFNLLAYNARVGALANIYYLD